LITAINTVTATNTVSTEPFGVPVGD